MCANDDHNGNDVNAAPRWKRCSFRTCLRWPPFKRLIIITAAPKALKVKAPITLCNRRNRPRAGKMPPCSQPPATPHCASLRRCARALSFAINAQARYILSLLFVLPLFLFGTTRAFVEVVFRALKVCFCLRSW